MNHQTVNRSLLTDPTVLPLRSIKTIAGTALVVAPHPDDETLGCGGAIALLCALGCSVQVLVMSDGTRSHPHSRKYPAPALQALRETETLEALAILGVKAAAVTFLRLQDGAISTLEAPGLQSAVACCRDYLQTLAPQTLFLPWRDDPHPDHRATNQIMRTALVEQIKLPRVLEYPIWDWDPEQQGTFDRSQQIVGWRLDTHTALETKLRAIASYRSQTTDLIDDDPEGFRLTPAMLSNFTRPWEMYLEEIE